MIHLFDGQRYEQTGNDIDTGRRVLCKLGDWERAHKSVTDKYLYIEDDNGVVVPLDAFRATRKPEGEGT